MSDVKAQEVAIKSPGQYLPEDQLKEVTLDLAQAQQAAKTIRVTSEEGMNEANAVCGKIRARQKGIEAFRLAIVKPFKDHIATIDKFFKDLQGKFDEPLTTIEDRVTKYRLSRKQPVATSTHAEGVGRTTFVRRAEYVIKDKNLIPDEFWCVDEKKIGMRAREVAANKELKVGTKVTDVIPGVEITVIETASYAGERG